MTTRDRIKQEFIREYRREAFERITVKDLCAGMQFRRHDRARIHYQKERTYYQDGRIVCKNRYKRTGQTDGGSKYISLAEYRTQHPHEVSRLSVRKSTRGYNDLKRELPGACPVQGTYAYRQWQA